MKRCKRTQTQSIVFPKSYGAARARKWLDKHGAKSGKLDRTPNTLRFRQLPPSSCDRRSYYTVRLGRTGIMKVICCPKRRLKDRDPGVEL